MKITKEEAKQRIISVLAEVGTMLATSMKIDTKENENITLIKAHYDNKKSLEIGITYFENLKEYEVYVVLFQGNLEDKNMYQEIRDKIASKLVVGRRATWKGV